MSLLSMRFLLFLAAAVAEYYVIPRQLQWAWLLMFNYIFYLASGPAAAVFILTTIVATLLGRLYLEHTDRALKRALRPDDLPRSLSTDEKKALKERLKQRKKWTAALVPLIDFGILAVLKCRNSAVDNMNLLFGTYLFPAKLLLPLRISPYTFQSMGYFIDVYRGKYASDRNPLRFALFISLFPQILQGPIRRYNRLALQLYGQERLSLTRIERGLQLMFWDYFKKIVITDRAAMVVSEVLGSYQSCHGILAIVDVLYYSLQLYGDFSGDTDIVTGAAERFGISLDANFRRPYFARFISDFWHRRYITLGAWMRDHVFHPFSLSEGANKLGKYCKKHFGKHVSRALPVCIVNLLVLFLIGVWHGPVWKFIVYGLYNGIITAAGNLLAPIYTQMTRKLHIPAESNPWTAVRILRTSLLVNISRYFGMAESLGAALVMMKNIVAGFILSTLTDGSPLRLGLGLKDCGVLAPSCVALLTVSLLREDHVSTRNALAVKPLAARWYVYLMLLFSILLLGQIIMTEEGFIYMQF